jgi:hypothetical protein
MSTDGEPFDRPRLPFVALPISSLCSSLVRQFRLSQPAPTLHFNQAGDQRGKRKQETPAGGLYNRLRCRATETNDPTEARHSRYAQYRDAQYRGQVATLTFGPATVRGIRSVKEDSSCIPVRRLVTIASQ